MASSVQDRIGAIAGQVSIKAPVDVKSTANLTLSGEQTIDGVTTSSSRILVADQTDTTENGIYTTASGTWTRTADFDGSDDVVKGCLVRVNAGTLAAKKVYAVVGTDPITPGTDAVTFEEWTVATTDSGVLLAEGSNLASASTVDLGAADADFVTITGTTTITSFGSTTTRNHMWVKFAGALTLTYNATSMILPTDADITTVAGDIAEFVRVSGSNWICTNYLRNDGTPIENQYFNTEVDVASASTTSMPVDSHVIRITGTTTITSLGSDANSTYPIYFIRFDDALTLTHNASSLILPGSANITTTAGDAMIAQYLGSGNWKILNYMYVSQTSTVAAADMFDGSIVGRGYQEYTTQLNSTTQMPADDTIPQITEGEEILSLSYTPQSSTNRVRITVNIPVGVDANGESACAALFIDTTAGAVRAAAFAGSSTALHGVIHMVYEYVPGDTSAHDYNVRVGPGGAYDVDVNGDGTNRLFGGVQAATIVVEEIKAS